MLDIYFRLTGEIIDGERGVEFLNSRMEPIGADATDAIFGSVLLPESIPNDTFKRIQDIVRANLDEDPKTFLVMHNDALGIFYHYLITDHDTWLSQELELTEGIPRLYSIRIEHCSDCPAYSAYSDDGPLGDGGMRYGCCHADIESDPKYRYGRPFGSGEGIVPTKIPRWCPLEKLPKS